MLSLRAGLVEKDAVPDLRDLEPSLISLKVPSADSFFLLKPALAALDFFFSNIRVLPGDPRIIQRNSLTRKVW